MNQQFNNQQHGTPGYPENEYGYPRSRNFEDEIPINWKKYIYLFLRNWHWFLITIGLALGVAFFKIRYTVPNYQANALLIIEEDEKAQDVLSEIRTVRFWRRQSSMANEKAKISSFTTINRAVDSLNQEIFWTAHGRIRIRPIYKNPRFNLILLNDSIEWPIGKTWFVDYIDKETFRLHAEELIDTILRIDSTIDLFGWKFTMNIVGKAGHDTYSFNINDPIELTKFYKQKLSIETDETEGTLIGLSSSGPVGEREVDFLNTLCSIYIMTGLERKQLIADNTSAFVEDQIELILDSLNAAENQLLRFRLSNNVINLSREGEISYEQLKSFHEQRTILKLKENYYNYLFDYVESRNDPNTIIAPTISDEGDQLLIGALKELQIIYEERENLGISVQSDNPSLESLNSRIISLRLRVLETIRGLIENNHHTQKQIDIEEAALLEQLKTLPINEQQLLNLKRKYDLYNHFYTFLLEKRAEAGIQKASTVSNVRLVDPARRDQLVKIDTDKRIVLLLSLVLGLFLPAVILLLRDQLDGKIREYGDISNNSDIPIIGIIGHSLRGGSLPLKEDINSTFTEFLRRIRTNITFSLMDSKYRVILVTSSISGEGKTFSAVNLATIIAMNQKKVLLVGCDLRKPTLHRAFNISNDLGVTNYLINQATMQEITFPTSVDGLFIIPAGPVPPNPAELIETARMAELFKHAKKNYDYVIIDTPPIALVADTLSLASQADLTLYLVRQNHSHKSVLEIANLMKEENKLPNIYLLINDMKPSKSMGFDYYHGYGKVYKYGYYAYSKYYSNES